MGTVLHNTSVLKASTHEMAEKTVSEWTKEEEKGREDSSVRPLKPARKGRPVSEWTEEEEKGSEDLSVRLPRKGRPVPIPPRSYCSPNPTAAPTSSPTDPTSSSLTKRYQRWRTEARIPSLTTWPAVRPAQVMSTRTSPPPGPLSRWWRRW